VARNLLLTAVSKEDLVAAHNLRQSVARTLGEVGLQASALEPEHTGTASGDTQPLFWARTEGNVAELALRLLSCNESMHYREVITATTAASLRYLGFERAYHLQWSRDRVRCHVRAKSDLSPRRLQPTSVPLTAREQRQLELAHTSGEAQLLSAEGGQTGLLHVLGADEVLVTPLSRGFQTPTFLALDRALSGSPIRMGQDRVGAEMLARTAALLSENLLLRKRRERAQKYSLTDPLTRLFNRRVGITSLDNEIARAKRNGAPLTVLMLDLDDFKRLNDTRGHLVGDQALRSTADILRKTMRKNDIVCRYGGEEFLVVLPDTSLEEASVSATRIFTAVAQAGHQLGLPLTISIGLAAVRAEEDTAESVLLRADRALYASKERGRNRFSVDGD
jgi:diguanylate cyclase (GGDEF)-like protein